MSMRHWEEYDEKYILQKYQELIDECEKYDENTGQLYTPPDMYAFAKNPTDVRKLIINFIQYISVLVRNGFPIFVATSGDVKYYISLLDTKAAGISLQSIDPNHDKSHTEENTTTTTDRADENHSDINFQIFNFDPKSIQTKETIVHLVSPQKDIIGKILYVYLYEHPDAIFLIHKKSIKTNHVSKKKSTENDNDDAVYKFLLGLSDEEIKQRSSSSEANDSTITTDDDSTENNNNNNNKTRNKSKMSNAAKRMAVLRNQKAAKRQTKANLKRKQKEDDDVLKKQCADGYLSDFCLRHFITLVIEQNAKNCKVLIGL